MDTLVSAVVGAASPDASRAWAGSGELGTLGDRVVDPRALDAALQAGLARELDHVRARWARVGEIVAALEDDDAARATDLLLEQAGAEERLDRHGAAEAWALAAHRLAVEAGLDRVPGALRRAARSARALGRFDDAATRYEQAMRDAEARGQPGDEVVAAVGRGNVAVDRGRWDDAERWYQRALTLLDDGAPRLNEPWQVCQNVAIVRRRMGDLEGARAWLDRAEGEAGPEPPSAARVEIGNGWGQLLLEQGRPREAEARFREALAHADTPRARATIEGNLAEALLAQGRRLDAVESARRAEAEALAGRVLTKLPAIYRLLAELAEAGGDQNASVFLDRALELVRGRVRNPFEEALTLEAWGRLRRREGEEERGVAGLHEAARLLRKIGLETRAQALEQEMSGEAGPSGPSPEDERRREP